MKKTVKVDDEQRHIFPYGSNWEYVNSNGKYQVINGKQMLIIFIYGNPPSNNQYNIGRFIDKSIGNFNDIILQPNHQTIKQFFFKEAYLLNLIAAAFWYAVDYIELE